MRTTLNIIEFSKDFGVYRGTKLVFRGTLEECLTYRKESQ